MKGKHRYDTYHDNISYKLRMIDKAEADVRLKFHKMYFYIENGEFVLAKSVFDELHVEHGMAIKYLKKLIAEKIDHRAVNTFFSFI